MKVECTKCRQPKECRLVWRRTDILGRREEAPICYDCEPGVKMTEAEREGLRTANRRMNKSILGT